MQGLWQVVVSLLVAVLASLLAIKIRQRWSTIIIAVISLVLIVIIFGVPRLAVGPTLTVATTTAPQIKPPEETPKDALQEKTPQIDLPNSPSPIMYADDFNDLHSGWPVVSDENNEFGYQDGQYYIGVKSAGGGKAIWNPYSGRPDDFIYEVDGSKNSGPPQSGYGALFRIQDGRNFYRFMIWQEGYYLIDKQVNGKFCILQGRMKSSFINGGDSKNRLKIVCKGSQIGVYINEHYLATVSDSAFSEGFVGLTVDLPVGTYGSALFDNMKVYRVN